MEEEALPGTGEESALKKMINTTAPVETKTGLVCRGENEFNQLASARLSFL